MYSASASSPLIVMLVDDSETDIFLHSIIIEQASFASNILTFEDGRDALNYLMSHKDDPEKLPCLLLLDLNMPLMNGLKFLEEWEKFPEDIQKKCKIVMLSSSENPKDIEAATSNKYVLDYFVKPLSTEALEKVKPML